MKYLVVKYEKDGKISKVFEGTIYECGKYVRTHEENLEVIPEEEY